MIGLGFGNFQAVTQAPFSFGNALQFDGANDFVSLSPEINTPNVDFTFSYWVKHRSSVSSLKPHLRPLTSGTTFIGMLSSNTKVRFTTIASSTADFTIPSVADLGWHHIVFSYQHGVGTRCYFDGVESVTGLKVFNQSCNLNAFGIYSTTTYSDINLDEIVVYNGYAASLSDAQALYNLGNGEFPSVAIPSQTPTAYWRMNGSGTDTTAVDEQGNYNGTLNNFPASGMWVAH